MEHVQTASQAKWAQSYAQGNARLTIAAHERSKLKQTDSAQTGHIS